MAVSEKKKYYKFLDNGDTIEIEIPLSYIKNNKLFNCHEFLFQVYDIYRSKDFSGFPQDISNRFLSNNTISFRKHLYFKNDRCLYHKITVLTDNEYLLIDDNLKFSNDQSSNDSPFYNDQFPQVTLEDRKNSSTEELNDTNLDSEPHLCKWDIANKFGENFIQRTHYYFHGDVIAICKTFPENSMFLWNQDLNFCSMNGDETKEFTYNCLNLPDSHKNQQNVSCYSNEPFDEPELDLLNKSVQCSEKEIFSYKNDCVLVDNSHTYPDETHFQRMSSPDPNSLNQSNDKFKLASLENNLQSLSGIGFSNCENNNEVDETLLYTPGLLSNYQMSPCKIPENKEKITRIISNPIPMIKCPVFNCSAFINVTKKHIDKFHSDLPKWKQNFYYDISIYNKSEKHYVSYICCLCFSVEFKMEWHLIHVHRISKNSQIFNHVMDVSEKTILQAGIYYMEAIINAFQCFCLQTDNVSLKTMRRYSRHIKSFLISVSSNEEFDQVFLGKLLGSNLPSLISVMSLQRVFNQQMLYEQLQILQKFFKFLTNNLDVFLPDGTSWLHQIFQSWNISELTEKEILLVACKT